MTMYQKLPNDPVMLLSFINTQLRDSYKDFDAFVAAFQVDKNTILDKMNLIDYSYDKATNQFI